MLIDKQTVKNYLDKQKIKVVEDYDFEKGKIKYSEKIKGWNVEKFRGNEEIVRAYILAKLVNDLGYNLENIEIETEYDIGRPKVNKPRIDIIVRENNGNAFLFMELKSQKSYEKEKEESIEKQLFNLAPQEIGQGKKVKYLVLYTIETIDRQIKDKCVLIDYEKFSSFKDWKDIRDFSDQIPERYGKAQKVPFVKGSEKKDLEKTFSSEQLDGIRKNLHNVLWGGGGTADNDVFSSLVNIILAKIQDEDEKKKGEKYDFQIFAYKDGETFETNQELFERVNSLYRKALKEKLNKDEKTANKSFVIDENKFSLSKLKYTVSELESFSFIDGKNSINGKDILGDFFEGIIREGFKQSKGQFFTHINIVKFILWGLKLDKLAIKHVNNNKEIPYVIDPSAGSGTFLIEYMKFITENLKRRFKDKLDDSRAVKNKLEEWFYPEHRENRWAKEYIYGVEHNFDLGTATKLT